MAVMLCRLVVLGVVLNVCVGVPAGVYIGKDGTVGASWGGYSASAGLGGTLSGGPKGGLHAQAGTPDGHFAAAGLGGSVSEGAGPQGQLYSTAGRIQPGVVQGAAVQPVGGGGSSQASASASASAQASSGGSGGGYQGGVQPVVVNRRPGSFFDDIFNIPISTLGAVNQYLNNRNKVAVPAAVLPVQQPQQSQSNAFSSASSSSSSSSSASSSSSSSSPSQPVSAPIDNTIYHGYQKNPNYNDIFNIPISVLGAVNRFLNGK